jgi:hypothetical protein
MDGAAASLHRQSDGGRRSARGGAGAALRAAARVARRAGASATLRDVQAMLAPYLGRPLVAKPAHSCGGVLFLEEAITAQQWSAFHVRATRDYY